MTLRWTAPKIDTAQLEPASSLIFSIPGEPRGKGRPRVSTRSGFASMYTDAKTVAYETLVKEAAALALRGRAPIEGPISVMIEVRLSPVASATKRAKASLLSGETPMMGRFDLDNYVKAVLDGCNKTAFGDDRQVVHLTAYVACDVTPSVTVAISPLNGKTAA